MKPNANYRLLSSKTSPLLKTINQQVDAIRHLTELIHLIPVTIKVERLSPSSEIIICNSTPKQYLYKAWSDKSRSRIDDRANMLARNTDLVLIRRRDRFTVCRVPLEQS